MVVIGATIIAGLVALLVGAAVSLLRGARRSQAPDNRAGPAHFDMVIGMPTFSSFPTVVWNRTLSIRKLCRSQSDSFTA